MVSSYIYLKIQIIGVWFHKKIYKYTMNYDSIDLKNIILNFKFSNIIIFFYLKLNVIY